MSTNKQGVERFFVEKGYVSCLTLTQKGAFLTFELQVGLMSLINFSLLIYHSNSK
jgi:hypothetical protein